MKGWKIPGPFRPDAMLLVRKIMPGKKKAEISIRMKPAIVR